MRKQWLVFIVVLLTGFTLWGCGSDRGSDSSSVTTAAPVADAAKSGNCTLCHTLDVHTSISGVAGKNPDTALGLGSAITHDCEDCHGGGQYHRGVGPIPYPSPDGARCATCHDQSTKVLASKHNADDATNTAMIADGHDTGYCQLCHTAEGSIELNVTARDKATIAAEIVANGSPVGPGQVEALANLDADGNPVLHNVVCGACHNALTKELVTVDTATWDPNANGVSDQFDLCTKCHNYQTNAGQIFGSGSVASGTAAFYHDTAWYRAIPTTHYDDPTTLSGQGTENGTTIINKVEGYVIRQNSANPCFDCHGHELKTNTRPRAAGDERGAPTIHTEWASSGHAGGLFGQKRAAAAALATSGLPEDAPRSTATVDAVMAAYASDGSSNGGFTHYDWDAANRQDCQMCHSSTGFMNYVAAPTTYNAALNDYSHLSGWAANTTPGSPQNELLYCWACHSNAESGALRVSGAVTASYTYNSAAVVFPDAGKSNTCVVCHSGRGNNEIVSTSSRFAGHHAPAAATLFSELTHVGGEFAGQNYANVAYFAHDTINVDGSGPCASCHMSGTEFPNHEFAVVDKDAAGVITGIRSTVCQDCHTGAHGPALVSEDNALGTEAAAAAFLEEESEGYQNAGQILLDLLANTLTNYAGAAITNASVVENDLRAFQNSKLTSDEKGGFAHNRVYVKRLIFDSIDYLEDGVIGGTIADYSVAYPEGAHWLGTARP